MFERFKSLFATAHTGGLYLGDAEQNVPDRDLAKIAELSWAFIAMNAIAKEIATNDFKILNREGEERLNAGSLKALQKPNAEETSYDIMWRTSMFLMIYGECFWVFKGNNFTCISSSDVTERFYSEKTDKLIRVRANNQEYSDIIRFALPGLGSNRSTKGMLSAVVSSSNVSDYIDQNIVNYFLNNATPQGFLMPDNENGITDESVKRLIVKMNNRHRGIEKFHRFGILNRKFKWIQTGSSLSDQNIEGASKMAKEKILAAFHVPEAVLGKTDGVRANSDVADVIFARRAVKPLRRTIEIKINADFLRKFKSAGKSEKTLGYTFNFNEIIVKDDEREKAEIYVIYVNSGIMTVDEVREELGMQTLPQQKEAVEEEKKDTAEENLMKLSKALGKKKEIKVLSHDEIDSYYQKKIDNTTALEVEMTDKVKTFINKSVNRIATSLRKKKAEDNGHVEYDELTDKDTSSLEKILLPFLLESGHKQSENVFNLVGFSGSVTKSNAELKKWALDRSKKAAESVITTINKSVQIAVSENEKVVDAISAIEERYSEDTVHAKAEEISITEISAAAGFATTLTYTLLPEKPLAKQWITKGDERTCQFCGPMNGVIIPVDEKFWNATDQMYGLDGGILNFKFSGGVKAFPMHGRCRCDIVPIFSKEAIPVNWDGYKDDSLERKKMFSYKESLKKLNDENKEKIQEIESAEISLGVVYEEVKKQEEYNSKKAKELEEKELEINNALERL